MKEAEIMLFGRNILLPEKGQGGEYSGESCVENSNGSGGGIDCDQCSDVNGGEGGKGDVDDQEKQDRFDEDKPEEQLCETTEQDEDRNPGHTDESHNNPSSDSDTTTPKTSSTDDDTASENYPKPENEQTGSTSAQPKALPKPDKILPCPRCNSADTKFCYYNNYNVKQPRHFCKSCQRYWTVGGTMRNVPVGAGRRKHKNYSSHFRHITISEPHHAGSTTDGFCHVNLKPNSGVLSFGPDSPLACNVSLSEKVVPNRENGTQRPAMQNVNGFGSPFVSWPYHPFVCPPPGYPIPCYYAPPVWNCSVPPNPWNVPFVSGPTSPLGKHSRNGELLNANNPEGNDRKNSESSIVVPKTLRIDDPEEAAKSSIWSTLGIDYDSFSLLKALQPKGDDKKSTVANSPLLQANPAALSRSISFHERV